MSSDFLVQDKGEPDAMAPQVEQHALEDLPVEVLVYLLGSRYCETDRLSNTAWSLAVRGSVTHFAVHRETHGISGNGT